MYICPDFIPGSKNQIFHFLEFLPTFGGVQKQIGGGPGGQENPGKCPVLWRKCKISWSPLSVQKFLKARFGFGVENKKNAFRDLKILQKYWGRARTRTRSQSTIFRSHFHSATQPLREALAHFYFKIHERALPCGAGGVAIRGIGTGVSIRPGSFFTGQSFFGGKSGFLKNIL